MALLWVLAEGVYEVDVVIGDNNEMDSSLRFLSGF